MLKLNVRTALITGASAGIGAEFARQLGASGTRLILVARRMERLEAIAAELRERYGAVVDVLQADLSKNRDIEKVEAAVSATEDLDLLVNNAGFGSGGGFSRGDVAPSVDMVQVHVVAAVRLARAALGGMVSRRRGYIINVASVAAFTPFSGVMYGSTKAFLVQFSQNLQYELAGTGIRIQALCPGMTHTEFHAAMGVDRSSLPGFIWMSARDVVRVSLKALRRRKVIRVPGVLNRMVTASMRCPAAAAVLRAVVGSACFRRRFRI